VRPPYSFSAAFELGWGTFTANYGVLLAASAIMLVVNLVDNVVEKALGAVHFLLQFAWALPFFLLVTMPLYAGVLLLAARGIRRGKCRFDDLSLGYLRLGPVVVWSLLMLAAMLVIAMPGIAAVWSAFFSRNDGLFLAVVIGVAVLYACVFLFLIARFGFVVALLADPDIGRLEVSQAVRVSWQTTAKCWPSLVGLQLVVTVLVLASLLLLCVGIVFLGYPLWIAVGGSAYALLFTPEHFNQRCRACGYPLSGTSGTVRCSECGTI